MDQQPNDSNGHQAVKQQQGAVKQTLQNSSQKQFQFALPTKNPEQVFNKPSANVAVSRDIDNNNTISEQQQSVKNQQDDGNKSQSSKQQSLSPSAKKRKGSFLQRMSQKQQQEEQKINQKRKQDQRAVFLQNVDYKATKEQLELIFQDCAKIAKITILKDQFTNHPKGCAYISFQTQQGVERALHLSGVTLRNRTIKVHRKRTNLPGMFGNKGGKKDQMGGIGGLLGMMQNYSRGNMARGRGRGRGR